jgi:hypothetical protein
MFVNDPVRLRPVAEAGLPVLARLQYERDLGGPFQWFGFNWFGGPGLQVLSARVERLICAGHPRHA